MCGTCGCGEGAGVTVTDPETGEHTHVLPDGTVITHSHGEDAEGHHHHEGQGGEHTHVLADGTVVTHRHPASDGDHGHDHGDHEHAHHDHGHDHHDHGPHDHGRHDDGRGHGHEGQGVETVAATMAPTVEAIEARVLAKNDALAERNRAFFKGRKLLTINLMSSPGSGKTTLLEHTLKAMEGRASVVEGDQETAKDAARIRATGAPVVQVNTGKGCHLEADMVWHGVERLDPAFGSILFVENVGNLVCPALFDLGEAARVVLFSVTEGEDKPLKYPHMFRRADLVLLTKVDLLPYLDFDREEALDSVRTVAPDAEVLEVSSKSGEGMEAWHRWLAAQRGAL